MIRSNRKTASVEPTIERAAAEVMLPDSWALSVQHQESGVRLTLKHPEQHAFAFEIAITSAGPVVRASAVALHLDASDEIVARCDRFAVEARREVSIASPSVRIEAVDHLSAEAGLVALTATRGDMRLRANDDMQLLGERVLLNCEGEPPLPAWLPEQRAEVLLPRQDTSGELLLTECVQPDGKEEA